MRKHREMSEQAFLEIRHKVRKVYCFEIYIYPNEFGLKTKGT